MYLTSLRQDSFIWSVIMSLPKGNLNKRTGALFNPMNQLNNFTDDKNEKELKLLNCEYREIDYKAL